jgi:hypothetical protein
MLRFLIRPLFLITLLLSLTLGWGIAHAMDRPNPGPANSPAGSASTSELEIGTVDVVPDRYKLGQELYIDTCAACHIALPPAVLPSQTWQILLQDSEHYGSTITPPRKPAITLIWNYLSTFSRPLRNDEETPFRMAQARHFKALHPQVKFAEPVTIATCATCHPKADVFNFRALKTEN